MRGETGAPDGFRFHREGGVDALVRDGDEAVIAPLAAALRGTTIAGASDRALRGRGAVISAPVPGRPGERMVVRRYRHGGALRFLGERIVLGASRPTGELAALAAAAAAGVPVARPIAALALRGPSGVFSRGLLATEEERDCDDLLERLRAARPTRAERRALAADLAAAVRRMHDAGVVHADLHVENVLVRRPPRTGVVLIDFDRARVLPSPAPDRLRFANLFRLDRSLEKTGLVPGRVSRADRIACLRAYLGAGGSGKRLSRAPGLKARLVRARLGLAFHRLSWRLGGATA